MKSQVSQHEANSLILTESRIKIGCRLASQLANRKLAICCVNQDYLFSDR